MAAELTALTAPPLQIDRETLRQRLADWRKRLREAPVLARQVLRKLLPEPLTLALVAEGLRFTGRRFSREALRNPGFPCSCLVRQWLLQ